MTTALVLGGGGLVGIAWELGVIAGLRELGVDLARADTIIGTSAGATVGAQISLTRDLSGVLAAQSAPPEQSPEFRPRVDVEAFGRAVASRVARGEGMRAALGAAALAAPTVTETIRRRVVAARLPASRWPDNRLLITAVDAATGELAVFDKDSGVQIVDAVTASGAVPGLWPPATVGGRRYIDGAVRSPTNADLADGHGRVIVLAPAPDPPHATAGVPVLRAGSVVVIGPDEESAEAFGPDPLAPAARAAALAAGLRQARTVLTTL